MIDINSKFKAGFNSNNGYSTLCLGKGTDYICPSRLNNIHIAHGIVEHRRYQARQHRLQPSINTTV